MSETDSSKPKRTRSASDAVKKFDLWWKYAQQNHHPRWERNWKLYNNIRTARSYKGITDTFIPMPFSIVETAVAALTSGRPSIDFVPQDMYQYMLSYAASGNKPDLKALNAKFDYFWECDNWDLKTIKSARSMFLSGIAGEWLYWDSDKPRIINLGPRDIIVDPALSDPMQLITNPNDYYTGRRYLTSKASLAAEKIVDADTGKVIKRFKDLSMVRPGASQAELTEREQKELLLGSIGDNKDMVECIEIVTGKTIKTVANRAIVIEERENKLGIHYLALGRFIADESVIVGKSILDPIAQQIEYLNDMSNQKQDVISDQLRPDRELDPLYKDHAQQIANGSPFGNVFPFKPGSLQPVRKDPIDSSVFAEVASMKNEIREAVGVDQIVQGVGNDENATATEINAQMSQAGQRFSIFVRMLEKELLYQRAKIVYKMMLYYTKDVDLVPVTTMEGPKFYKFDPSQFNDSYEPRIQLESTVQNKKARDQERTAKAFEIIIADPTNNLYEAKKIMYKKMIEGLTDEELDKIIGAEPPQDPMGAGMSPMGDPMADPMAGADPMAEPMVDPATGVPV